MESFRSCSYLCIHYESVSQSVTMFLVRTLLVLFTYGVCEIEIQCSIIRHEIHVMDAASPTNLTKNSTLLKKIDNMVIESESTNPSEVKTEKIEISTGKKKPQVDLDGANISEAPLVEEENRILVSKSKTTNLRQIDDVGNRHPKFFGSLAFLTGLGAGSLATAASVNANAFVRLLNPVPLPIGPPGFVAGFYEPQHYLPFPYPLIYPVPRVVNNYQNFPNGILVHPSPLPPRISNVTTAKIPDKIDTNSGMNDEMNEQPENEKAQESIEPIAPQADLKRHITPETNEDETESPVIIEEEVELRQISGMRGTTTTTTTSTPRTTTTEIPATMNTTQATNVTVPTTSPMNTTESWPFYGYYGGSPQEVGHVILTTEDPQQRYLKDYTENGFALPFERPAVFSPYQNAESYPNSFVHSFSSGEPFPEFFNTIESDRYVYDSENRRNLNGFRPILK